MPDILLIVTIGTALLLLLGFFISFMTFTYRKRRLEHKEEVENLAAAYQQEILKAQIEMQEQTFLSISQEIHDNVGQVLSLVRLNVSTLDCGEATPVRQKIDASKDLLDQAIEDLRDLSKRLNSQYVMKQSLSALLRFQLGLLRKTGAFETSFRLVGEERPDDPKKRLILLRIVQEAFQNIIRHADATSILVELTFSADRMALSIKDDGVGFPSPDPASPKPSPTGTGTQNMYYRAGLIGARLTIKGSPDRGTHVLIEIPSI